MKVIEMTCSKCGAPLKPDLDAGKAKCEYCGHYILIEQEDTIEEIRAKEHAKSYGYHKGKLEAEAEARKKKKRNKIIRNAVIIGVIFLLVIISIFSQEASKPKVNPFECITVTFQGKDGKGETVLERKSNVEGIDTDLIQYDISKRRDLTQGETISIRATSESYRLTETSKSYIVEGLDEYLKELEGLSGEDLEIIHVKAESGLKLNLDRSKKMNMFVDMQPVKLFLLTDGKQSNQLFDVFEARFATGAGEKILYVMTCFENVIVRNGEQTSLQIPSGMYRGTITQVESSLWITAYDSIEEIRADILSSPDVYMELKELDL